MRGLSILSLSLLLAASAGAQEDTPTPAETPVAAPAPLPPAGLHERAFLIHGFVSPGFLVTSHGNNYLARTADRGSFEFAEAGINFTKPLAEDLRVGLQLFARDLGPTGNYSAKLDWFYLDYRWRDWLGLRAGRVKIPFGLYNEAGDVDAARVPVLLPQSVYPITNRDFLLAQTGAELYGYKSFGAAGALDYRAYAGTIQIETVNTPGAPTAVQELSTPVLAGARVLYETPLHGLRLGASLQQLRLDGKIFVAEPAPGGVARIELPALLWVASADYFIRDLHLAAEYSHWTTEIRTSDPVLFPPRERTTSERGYAMTSYRVTSWLHLGAYYSIYYPDIDLRDEVVAREFQHDAAGTVRFDLSPHWLVKVEGHYLRGTAALAPALNDERAIDELSEHWTLFLVKTTAYF